MASVVVCRPSSSVTLPSEREQGAWKSDVGMLPAVGPAGRQARGRSGGRHCTAGQSCYVPLRRHLALLCSAYIKNYVLVSFYSKLLLTLRLSEFFNKESITTTTTTTKCGSPSAYTASKGPMKDGWL